jgi:hypothetical protein
MLTLLAVTLFTACGNDDEPENKQTFTAPINCRAIDGDQVVFSQGTSKVEVDFTNMKIKFVSDYKDIHGQSHTLTTPDMKLTNVSSSVYEFTSSAGQPGSTMIESLGGYIDMATGMMWYTINTGSGEVVCTSHLLYAYTNTTMVNPDNNNHGTHQQSAYLFVPDVKGETCIMQISNFVSNLNGAVVAQEVQYQGLTLTPTTTGYTITADEVESSFKGFYTLTDVNITLDDQCRVMNGSFKCNGLEFTLSGGLFSYN